MPIINTLDFVNVLLLLSVTVLLIFLSKETKRSIILLLTLFVYVIVLIAHTVLLATIDNTQLITVKTITQSLTMDFALIAISYFSYLWVDDIEAKFRHKKSIDNSLEWFWKKV